jgi:hypothetical protein
MLTSPLTHARLHIAGILTEPLRDAGVQLHTEPPEIPAGTCVVLVPGEPWVVRKGLTGVRRVTVEIVALVPIAGGRSMLTRLEDIVTVITNIPAVAGSAPRAERQTWAGGEFFAASIPVTVEVD